MTRDAPDVNVKQVLTQSLNWQHKGGVDGRHNHQAENYSRSESKNSVYDEGKRCPRVTEEKDEISIKWLKM